MDIEKNQTIRREEMTLLPSKRVSIVSLSLVKESSLLYGPRRCQTSDDAYALIRPFIENKDREHLVGIGLNSKNEPTMVHWVHIGTANQSIRYFQQAEIVLYMFVIFS